MLGRILRMGGPKGVLVRPANQMPMICLAKERKEKRDSVCLRGLEPSSVFKGLGTVIGAYCICIVRPHCAASTIPGDPDPRRLPVASITTPTACTSTPHRPPPADWASHVFRYVRSATTVREGMMSCHALVNGASIQDSMVSLRWYPCQSRIAGLLWFGCNLPRLPRLDRANKVSGQHTRSLRFPLPESSHVL
ncbi:hypothetical protein F4861DRAFT_48507 [Xylaria intraflava]|nr:hypothetical protein F4861DRAFT_48507 [Xylaria intraflava]